MRIAPCRPVRLLCHGQMLIETLLVLRVADLIFSLSPSRRGIRAERQAWIVNDTGFLYTAFRRGEPPGPAFANDIQQV